MNADDDSTSSQTNLDIARRLRIVPKWRPPIKAIREWTNIAPFQHCMESPINRKRINLVKKKVLQWE